MEGILIGSFLINHTTKHIFKRDNSILVLSKQKCHVIICNRTYNYVILVIKVTFRDREIDNLVMNDNPRLFNNPPRSSKEWKLEYNARTSAERSNKREKLDFKLEDGRHRSTKMWYCRLYHILMLQHLDAWDLPPESLLRKLILDVA